MQMIIGEAMPTVYICRTDAWVPTDWEGAWGAADRETERGLGYEGGMGKREKGGRGEGR